MLYSVRLDSGKPAMSEPPHASASFAPPAHSAWGEPVQPLRDVFLCTLELIFLCGCHGVPASKPKLKRYLVRASKHISDLNFLTNVQLLENFLLQIEARHGIPFKAHQGTSDFPNPKPSRDQTPNPKPQTAKPKLKPLYPHELLPTLLGSTLITPIVVPHRIP